MAITKVTEGVRTLGTGEVATANMATDPTNASNLSSGSVPLAQLGNVDTTAIVANQDDIALLGFKVAANGSLARYNLVDQSIDAFEDASGVDASASTNETRDASGKYYSGTTTVTENATGGTITTWSDGGTDYVTHTFLTNANFIPPSSGDIDVMLVGGGGGSANAQSGAGGGGGMITMAAYGVTAATYAMVIGSGGAGTTTLGGTGGSTTGFGETATGGGGGGFGRAGGAGANGGGGGDGAHGGGVGTAPSATNGTGFGGYNGGTGGTSKGGGGGGITAIGDNSSAAGGGGGAGKQYNLDGNNYYWGGGGGGAAYAANGGSGATGGGGGGGTHGGSGGTGGGSAINSGGAGSSSGTTGGTGGANSGGGAGGGSNADGGSGIVQVRYVAGTFTSIAYEDMTLVSNAQTAESAPTTGDLVITYTNGAGTATINTDIKAYISRDGSAYSSAVTLVDQGDTGGHTILTANGVDLSGITSGTSMRWKIETLNQSASKETRIQAVSLGWS